MSRAEGSQPRRFRVAALYAQIRVANTSGIAVGWQPTAYVVLGFERGRVLDETQIHPEDLARLLTTKQHQSDDMILEELDEDSPAASWV